MERNGHRTIGAIAGRMIIITAVIAAAVSAKSLWNDNSELFLDKKPQAGDPVKIVFDDKIIVKYKNASKGLKSKSTAPLGAASPIISFLPQVDFNENATYTHEGQSQSQGEMKGTITATVTAVLGNKNLSIAGTHTIIVNGETETVNVTGTVSPKSVRKGGVVSSTDIMNPTITYSGIAIGNRQLFAASDIVTVTNVTMKTNIQRTNFQAPGFVTNIVPTVSAAGVTTYRTNIVATNVMREIAVTNVATNQEIKLDIEKNKKQKLIVDYLNKMIDVLFRY
ncbi:MAG: flagellar basal body L-ring protein FlgH [Spirochaetes bacterium]|nr:flagellar basal body L-ring protein FlgH [Spirochaetota bacterium]